MEAPKFRRILSLALPIAVPEAKYRKTPFETRYCPFDMGTKKPHLLFFCIANSTGRYATTWLPLFYVTFQVILLTFIYIVKQDEFISLKEANFAILCVSFAHKCLPMVLVVSG